MTHLSGLGPKVASLQRPAAPARFGHARLQALPQGQDAFARSAPRFAGGQSKWVQVPSGTQPDDAFVRGITESAREAVGSMPPAWQALLRNRGFGYAVYRHADDYFSGIARLNELMAPDSAAHALDTMRKHQPGFAELDEEAQRQASLKSTRQLLGMAGACYIAGQQQVFVHQQVTVPGLLGMQIVSQPVLSAGVLRHELGHYVDYLPGSEAHRLINRPAFIERVFEDLENARAQKLIPIDKLPDGRYTLTPEGLAEARQAFASGALKALPEHFAYYVPLSPIDQPALAEVFAELFATLHGGGAHPDPAFIRERLYPRTSAWLRDELLPEVLKQASGA